MTLAALFVAQATNIELSLTQQMAIFGVSLLTSKGACGITGAGFIALVGTLSVVPAIPLAGMALILGIDRFMSEGRAIVNIIGNAVATIVMAKSKANLIPIGCERSSLASSSRTTRLVATASPRRVLPSLHLRRLRSERSSPSLRGKALRPCLFVPINSKA